MSSRTLESRFATAADLLNPVFVKEVRAALRGRFFRVVFAVMLSFAVVGSLGFMVLTNPEARSQAGGGYFLLLCGCMGLGLNGLVPFSAMLSMTAESDENTLEMLQLSGIAGSRIVGGKLLSALVQALLIYGAFLPFLVLAFLLHGVGIGMLAASLAGTMVSCATLSSFGILLGSLARARWARVLMLLSFALILLQSTQLVLIFLMGSAIGGSGAASISSFSLLGLIGGLAATGLFAALASVRLTHAEENRSSAPRAAVSLMILAALLGFALGGDPRSGMVYLFCALGLGALPMFYAVTERERLPRAVPVTLPRTRALRVLAAPWLPGGARGALFVLLHLALAVLGFEAIALWQPAAVFPEAEFARLKILALLFVAFALLPAGLLASFTRKRGGLVVVRASILGFFGIANVAPLLLGFFLGSDALFDFAPIRILFRSESDSGGLSAGLLDFALALLAVLALVANVPRLWASFRELLAIPARAAQPIAEGSSLDAAPRS